MAQVYPPFGAFINSSFHFQARNFFTRRVSRINCEKKRGFAHLRTSNTISGRVARRRSMLPPLGRRSLKPELFRQPPVWTNRWARFSTNAPSRFDYGDARLGKRTLTRGRKRRRRRGERPDPGRDGRPGRFGGAARTRYLHHRRHWHHWINGSKVGGGGP
jgi:hypothetical protein